MHAYIRLSVVIMGYIRFANCFRLEERWKITEGFSAVLSVPSCMHTHLSIITIFRFRFDVSLCVFSVFSSVIATLCFYVFSVFGYKDHSTFLPGKTCARNGL